MSFGKTGTFEEDGCEYRGGELHPDGSAFTFDP